jgi:hypothetical protein
MVCYRFSSWQDPSPKAQEEFKIPALNRNNQPIEMRVLTNLKDTVATDALIGRIPILYQIARNFSRLRCRSERAPRSPDLRYLCARFLYAPYSDGFPQKTTRTSCKLANLITIQCTCSKIIHGIEQKNVISVICSKWEHWYIVTHHYVVVYRIGQHLQWQ